MDEEKTREMYKAWKKKQDREPWHESSERPIRYTNGWSVDSCMTEIRYRRMRADKTILETAERHPETPLYNSEGNNIAEMHGVPLKMDVFDYGQILCQPFYFKLTAREAYELRTAVNSVELLDIDMSDLREAKEAVAVRECWMDTVPYEGIPNVYREALCTLRRPFDQDGLWIECYSSCLTDGKSADILLKLNIPRFPDNPETHSARAEVALITDVGLWKHCETAMSPDADRIIWKVRIDGMFPGYMYAYRITFSWDVEQNDDMSIDEINFTNGFKTEWRPLK